MRLRTVLRQWATIAVLLLILAIINHYWPHLTRLEVGPQQQAGKTTQRGGNYDAIDGDSFRAGTSEVRLHGIDAPEYRQTCRDTSGSTIACGKLARDHLSKLLRGRTVSCTVIDNDRYGREVAVCRDGDLEINREMVRLGWALAYRKHARTYIAAEDEARRAKRGLWQWEFEKPQDYRDRNRAVEGHIAAGED